jgi:hypothetical protein
MHQSSEQNCPSHVPDNVSDATTEPHLRNGTDYRRDYKPEDHPEQSDDNASHTEWLFERIVRVHHRHRM